jgi:threonine/homoserine/homoserine lactone efflux protein
MLQESSALLGILGALAVGVVSPGPSFVLIARTAVASSRADGVAAAFGMGGGGLVFASAALLGLHGVLLAVPSLYIVLKIAGGLYLGYLGVRIWSSARKPLTIPTLAPGSRKNVLKSVVLGFTTQISNPKTAASTPASSRRFSRSRHRWASTSRSSFSRSPSKLPGMRLWQSRCPRKARVAHTCVTKRGWIVWPAALMVALGLKLVASAPRI